MRILIATETYPPNVNGAAVATERLAKELANRGNQVVVVAPSTSFKRQKTRSGNLTIYGLRSIPFNRTQGLRTSPQVLHIPELNEIIKETNPEIVHIVSPGLPISQTAIRIARRLHIPVTGTSHIMAENFLPYITDIINIVNPGLPVSRTATKIARKLRIPVTGTSHIMAENFSNLKLPDIIEKLLNTSVWKIYARLYSMLNLIIAPSPAAADLLIKLKVNTKIVVISNGIDLKKFNPNNNGSYLKKRYKLPQKPIILFLGRIDKEKNIDVLIKALGSIKNKFNFHAVIVGKGREERYLKKLASEVDISDKITFTGHLPKNDLPNIYAVADIFVMPGTAELQSLATMEAMASGLPIIAANAVALPHLVKNNRNGYLFKPGSEKELAKKLKVLLDNPEKRIKLGKVSLELIKEHEMEEVLKKTEKVYIKVIKAYKTNLIQKRSERKDVLRKLRKISLKRLLPQELRA